jgi:hypothetical protein
MLVVRIIAARMRVPDSRHGAPNQHHRGKHEAQAGSSNAPYFHGNCETMADWESWD